MGTCIILFTLSDAVCQEDLCLSARFILELNSPVYSTELHIPLQWISSLQSSGRDFSK